MRGCLVFLVVSSMASMACGTDVEDLFGEASGPAGSGGSTNTVGPGNGGAPNTTMTVGPAQTTTGDTTAETVTTVTSGPDLPVVPCATEPCLPGQICCLSRVSQQLDACSDGACAENSIPLACNGPEDCPGKVCCGKFQDNNGWIGTECKSECNGNDDLVMCTGHPDICMGNECRASQFLGQGYAYCAN